MFGDTGLWGLGIIGFKVWLVRGLRFWGVEGLVLGFGV